MKIIRATCRALNLPFYCERVTRAMNRALTHSERVYVYRIETDTGIVGYGDSLGIHEVDSLIGRNPFALMHDDGIGIGPQIAVLDAAGRAAGVPIHALLGKQVRRRCPLSWWDIDMPPEEWAAEAEESLRRGYTCFKMKARPWRDIIEQVETVGRAVPADYRFDVDFNGFLLTQPGAEAVLSRLDEHPNVGMYESPFYLYQDLPGARLLRERVRKPIVEHFREEILHARACDGFVIGGGVTATLRQAALAASFSMPFWLQMVGTGITTAFAAHLGSVLTHARLPCITCHELWEDDLLQERLEVVDGYVEAPQSPGLGVEVDEEAIQRYTVDPQEPTPTARYRQAKRILRVHRPAGEGRARVWEFTSEAAYQREFYQGNLPGFCSGVSLEITEDDGSAAFEQRHRRLDEEGW